MADDEPTKIHGNNGGVLTPFTPGEVRQNQGRAPGVPNKLTRVLKEAIIQAASTVGKPRIVRDLEGHVVKVERGKGGLDGYLEHLALNEPRSFCGLLGRILPVTIKAEHTEKKVYRSLDQLRAELEARGIPLSELAAEPPKVVRLRKSE